MTFTRPVNELKSHPLNDRIYDAFNAEASYDLIESIKASGIIDPLVINTKGEIISGHRRWHVAQLLGITHVPCDLAPEGDERQLLIEYNRYRIKTVSERMREAELIKEIEESKASYRRAMSRTVPITEESGRASEKIADTVGMKRKTFEKATKIYETAKTNKNAAGILEKIDRGELSIDAGFKGIRKLITEETPKTVVDEDPPPDFIKSFTSWAFGENDPRFGQPHPGRIPGQIPGNLIWYLTKPNDLVIDPMAGGGSTLDAAKFLRRRAEGYDIDPKRPDITKWDISKGFPEGEAPQLIFIDPPYWNMIVEDYHEDSISNSEVIDYHIFLGGLINNSYNRLKEGGYLAIINMSSYYRLPIDCEHYYIDWPIIIYEYMRSKGFIMRYRIAVTYPTTLYGGYHVTAAKEHRNLLPNLGDIIVGQKG